MDSDNKVKKSDINEIIFSDGVFAPAISTSLFEGYLFPNLMKIYGNLNTSNVTDMNNMFFGANKLTSIDLSSLDTSKVTDMHFMFYQTGLKSITFPDSWDTSNVTNMESMFYWSDELESINNISSWDISNVTDMHEMFLNAIKVSKLDLGGWDTSNVTNMDSLFAQTRLIQLTLGSKSIFDSSVNLPEMSSYGYSGSWERIDPVTPISIFSSSNDFMENYDGSMPGTYERQKGTYIISYELDGGINDPNNPIEYTFGTGIDSFKDALKDSLKDGYTFLGWYNYSGEKITSISSTSYDDIVLYAKWEKNKIISLPKTDISLNNTIIFMIISLISGASLILYTRKV